mgnify:CR=1 FL=1
MATPSDHHAEIAFPPFDATTFGSQLFWFAIVFGALYLLISRAVAPRIAGILEDRRARIAGDLDDAAKKQAQAQAAAEAHEKSLADMRAMLATGPQPFRKVAAATFEDGKRGEAGLAAMVSLASSLREPDGTTPISARYHLFLRATEGAFATRRAAWKARAADARFL